MSALLNLQTKLASFGPNYIRFKDDVPRKTTSNCLSRWFSRVCAYCSGSERNANQAVCKKFLKLIKADREYGSMYSWAKKFMLLNGRYKTGKPLSGRIAAEIIGKIFSRYKPEREKQIEQYASELSNRDSEHFLRKIMNAGPMPNGGLPRVERYLNLYAGDSLSAEKTSVLDMYPAKRFVTAASKQICMILRERYRGSDNPITDVELRTAVMKTLVEMELRNVYLGPTENFIGRSIESQQFIFQKWPDLVKSNAVNSKETFGEKYKRDVLDFIAHIGDTWMNDLELVSRVEREGETKFRDKYE